MRILSGSAAETRVRKIAARGARYAEVEPEVSKIISDVRQQGDRSLRKYAEKWDGLTPQTSLRVPKEEIAAAWKSADAELKLSLRVAEKHIRNFAKGQKPREWTRTQKGISVGQVVRPLDSVGCYVPAGRHPLVSTLLMTVIPAQVAEVTRIAVVTPQPRPEVLAAAGMLGIDEIYRVGGAQAIAALAYGTKSISRVDKIVGPGNLYVTAAKKLVAFDCSIDFLAGPTEVLTVSDKGTPEFIAADLVAQAEHDAEALAVFITTRETLAHQVSRFARKLASSNKVARQSLQKHGAILVSESSEQSFVWANAIAPEHITVDEGDVPLVRNAGSIFVGDYSPQAGGDYATGPNHVLPTHGGTRFRGGLGVQDFVKVISVQKLSRAGLEQISSAVEFLAAAEGLQAHAASIRLRCGNA